MPKSLLSLLPKGGRCCHRRTSISQPPAAPQPVSRGSELALMRPDKQRDHQRTQIDLDQLSVTAMEESGDYRVTRSKGRGPGRKIRRVIFRHLDEAPARRAYKRTPPAPGYII